MPSSTSRYGFTCSPLPLDPSPWRRAPASRELLLLRLARRPAPQCLTWISITHVRFQLQNSVFLMEN
jgi:hypothetical protein